MKKKIFLISLMVVVLALTLAISAFAEEIVVSKTESAEYGTIIKLNADPGLDNAKQYASTLKKINDSGDSTQDYVITTDGTYFYVFPSSYFVNERSDGKFEVYVGTSDNPGIVQALEQFNTEMQTDYYSSYTVNKTYGDRRIEAFVRFEFPTDVTWSHPDWCCMRNYPSLVEVRFNHPFGAVANGMFQKAYALKTVIGFENVDPTLMGTGIFMSCSGLEYVKFPTNITRIPGSTFWGAGKVVIANISELTSLTTIGTQAFKDSGKLNFVLPDSVTTIEKEAFRAATKDSGSITINPTSKLVTIGDYAFHDCRKTSSLYIPSTVTSIGEYAFGQNYNIKTVENFENCQVTTLPDSAFASCINLKSIKLPKGLTTLGNAFSNCGNLTLMYIPHTVTSISDTLTDNTKNILFIYTGDNVSVLSACAKISSAKAVKYTYSNGEQFYKDMLSSEGTSIIVYSYDKCKAFYNDVHNYIIGTGDCMDGVSCERCPAKLPGTTGHTNYERVTFESLTSSGLYEYGCSNEGCTKYDASETLKPVFTAKGYSTNPEKNAINGGYTVNLDSLALYKRFYGNITYGVVIANANSFDGEFFDEDNKVNTTKAVQAEIDHQYSNFDCSISFGANTGVELDLVICAYVITDDGVTFIQKDSGSDVTIGGSAFKSVTLASIVALVPAPAYKEN